MRPGIRFAAFETYIYWSQSIGKEFADALSERARTGATTGAATRDIQSTDHGVARHRSEAGRENSHHFAG